MCNYKMDKAEEILGFLTTVVGLICFALVMMIFLFYLSSVPDNSLRKEVETLKRQVAQGEVVEKKKCRCKAY